MTLIEVVLAVTILGLSMAVLLTGVSRCLAVMRSAKLYEEAQWTLSKGEVDHPLLASSDVKDLVVDPPEEYDNGFSYSREVDDDDDEDGLHVMRIKVSWSTRGQEACEVLVRYVLQTEPKP